MQPRRRARAKRRAASAASLEPSLRDAADCSAEKVAPAQRVLAARAAGLQGGVWSACRRAGLHGASWAGGRSCRGGALFITRPCGVVREA
eukprot:5707147-Prymnesium_polylepis.1